MILMLGDAIDDRMAVSGVKWLHQQGCHVMAMSPDKIAFPESMLKIMLPVGGSLLVGAAFRAGRKYPKECRETRIRSTVNSVYIETLKGESLRKEDVVMMSVSDFIAVISLCITCVSLGYMIAMNNQTKK
ncbi:MAG: hypothetical protein Q4A32_00725 [Lachnospiraceae bacterium]|nr:hypothetical protein [Lachnospiraceae bacterium]